MKKLLLTLAAGVLAVSLAPAALAAGKVTLSGTLVCAKCKLHETTDCQNVLQVDQNGKTVNYYLAQNKTSKAFHDNICQNDGEKVTVTGKVASKGGKETMTASKIEAVK